MTLRQQVENFGRQFQGRQERQPAAGFLCQPEGAAENVLDDGRECLDGQLLALGEIDSHEDVLEWRHEKSAVPPDPSRSCILIRSIPDERPLGPRQRLQELSLPTRRDGCTDFPLKTAAGSRAVAD
jgi:hypothetical protein